YWLVSNVERATSRVDLQEVIKKETAQKIMTVYSNSQKIGDVSYLNEQSRLGEAAVVGSDGWLSMYLSDERALNNYNLWMIINNEGGNYQATKVLYDSQTQIVYFKIKGLPKVGEKEMTNEQFKVIGFSEGEKIGNGLFVYQNGLWNSDFLDYEYYLTENPHLDSAPVRLFSLQNKNLKPGSMVINNQGRLVGFVMENGVVLQSIHIARVLPGVLNKQQIIYPTFMVEGWFSNEQKLVSNNNIIKGFLVTNVLKTEAKLLKGDIIMEINGQIVEDENLWYNLRGENARLKVLRRGKVLDLEAVIKENIFK
ncbi:MAG: hypothetical protein Q7J14_01020, partial [Candidatus Magasanikbacteria bacterium]|nr:hypothetical protein [Candidatus Magasanikbacteria bacterium]